MNNFGVIEVASTRTTHAPGWAYVPDTAILPAAPQTTNRKRARNQPNLTLGDLSAREEAKIRKELEVLDRDNQRDVAIPIPPKAGGGSGSSRSAGKHTPNVRKILTSQKTFANHLDDFEAFQGHSDRADTPLASAASHGSSSRAAGGASSSSRKASKKPSAVSSAPDTPMPDAPPLPAILSAGEQQQQQQEEGGAGGAAAAATAKPPPPWEADSAILAPYTGPALPPPHPLDGEPLLATRLPPLPTDAELRALAAAPPLTYAAARAGWDAADDRRYPVRVFCEVCGYWGRVRCLKCGTRVCALDCLDVHREECITRYGL